MPSIVPLALILILLLAACAPGELPHTQAMAIIEPEPRILIFEREFKSAEIEQGRATYAQFPTAPREPDTTGRYGAPPHDGCGHTWHHTVPLE